ncbi:MAG: hypothetical protein ACTICG_09205 [Corynebacterium casei]|uniref:hypothetical protein n=1 Tax=Corynebacterium casei TaxID=160386 RepID=UPI003F8F4F06
MSSTNKKNPAGATNANEAIEQSAKGSKSKAYLLRKVNHTSGDYETWSGEHISSDKYMTVLLPKDAVADMWHEGPQLVQVNAACASAMSAEARRRKQAEAEEENRRREHAARDREELLLIKDITGLEVSRDDLIAVLAAHIRNGDDYGPIIKAMEAIDALDLQRAGLTSWSDFDEEDEF